MTLDRSKISQSQGPLWMSSVTLSLMKVPVLQQVTGNLFFFAKVIIRARKRQKINNVKWYGMSNGTESAVALRSETEVEAIFNDFIG